MYKRIPAVNFIRQPRHIDYGTRYPCAGLTGSIFSADAAGAGGIAGGAAGRALIRNSRRKPGSSLGGASRPLGAGLSAVTCSTYGVTMYLIEVYRVGDAPTHLDKVYAPGTVISGVPAAEAG